MRWPSLVVPMLAGGIAAGDREQVRRTASALLGWTLLVLTPLAVLLAVLAEPIARLLLGGGDEAEVALAARFLLVFAPQVVLYGIGIVLTGVLQAHRRFAGPALAPLLSSLVVAGAYLLFAGIGGDPDAADLTTPAELVLGVGTTLGVVALSLSLLAPMRGLRLGLRPTLRFPVGAAPRVRRLAVAGVLTLAGQQLVAAVAIRLASDGAPDGTQVVYAAGLTLFLVPWAALAVPLATSAYPGLAERAEDGDEAGFARALAPVAVLVVAASALAAAVLVAVAGPMARVFLSSGSDAAVARPARHDPGLRARTRRLRPGRAAHPRPLRAGTLEGADGVRRRRLAPGRRRRRRPGLRAAGRRPGARAGDRAQPRRHGRRAVPCWSWSPARPAPRRCAGSCRPGRRPYWPPSSAAGPAGGSAGPWGPIPCPTTAFSPPWESAHWPA